MEIKFCQNCGKKLALNDIFCSYCGTKQHNLDLDNDSFNDNKQYDNGNDYSSFTTKSTNISDNGVSFGEAIKLFWKNAFSLSGCSSRSEFWFSYLFSALVNIFLLGIILMNYDSLLDSLPSFRVLKVLLVLAAIIFIFNEIAYISVAVRRLHDTNLSGGLFWIFLVPFIGWVILLVLLCQPSNPDGVNKFGKRDNTMWYKRESAWIALIICAYMLGALVVHLSSIDYQVRQDDLKYEYNLHHHSKSYYDDNDDEDDSSINDDSY